MQKEAGKFFPRLFGLQHQFFGCVHALMGSDHVHPRQGPILCLILHSEGMSQADIVRKMNVSAATVAVSLARLEKLGLILREKNQQNQRANVLRLTEKGREMARHLEWVMSEIARIALTDFTPEEVETLSGYCERMTLNLQNKYGLKECVHKHAPHV